MATSHGGLLYYVVQVPRDAQRSPPPPPLTAAHGYLDEPQLVTSTPKSHNAAGHVLDRSTDSGWDNPFRPDGDLSREADEIVELIKGGKPITPTPEPPAQSAAGGAATQAEPAPAPRNGRAPGAPGTPGAPGATGAKPAGPGAVELQRATVAPSDASQVEHVVLKKKPKCKCCVIQ